MVYLNPPYWATFPSALYLHWEKAHLQCFNPTNDLIRIPWVLRDSNRDCCQGGFWVMGNVCSFVDGCLHKERGIIYLIPSLSVSSVQTAGFTYTVSLQRDLLCTVAIIKFIPVMLHRRQLLSVILRCHTVHWIFRCQAYYISNKSLMQ